MPYNIVLVSAIHQHESAITIIFNSIWAYFEVSHNSIEILERLPMKKGKEGRKENRERGNKEGSKGEGRQDGLQTEVHSCAFKKYL